MKKLFFKELKLSIHPLVYLFTVGFGVLALVPSYPAYISLIYGIVSYTFLFLGANKGQTTNDLFYTCQLPIRKQDVVKARMCSITYLNLLTFLSSGIFLAIRFFLLRPTFIAQGIPMDDLGLDINQGFALFGSVLFTISIVDYIYIPWFYKTGKSVVGPTLVSIIVFSVLTAIFVTAIPSIPGVTEALTIGHEHANYLLQIGILVVGLATYISSRFIINKIATKRLIKLDF